MLDAGFYHYNTLTAFDSLRNNNLILGTYDFVKNETSVAEDDTHGMYCLSILAANRPGQLVGTAPKASYYLFRTEDVASEFPIEEHNWVVAAEKADSLGVDIITSSLGYTTFDDPAFNHSYADMNGKTTMITNGADMAMKKGMIVCNSAGNADRVVGNILLLLLMVIVYLLLGQLTQQEYPPVFPAMGQVQMEG
jgi:hypothetical protein